MRITLVVLAFSFSIPTYAKEWKSLRQYQKETHNVTLSPSDWLASDRKHNTLVWQHANAFNLSHERPQEYQTIKERRDFYLWVNHEFQSNGHEVYWQTMAYFITSKMRLTETFPHCVLTPQKIKRYARQGSEVVFNNAFEKLNIVFNSDSILIGEEALKWDETMLHLEQHVWVESIYINIDAKSLKQIRRMTTGKFWYALAVPNELRFKNDISNPEDRYQYGLQILRPYCINHSK